ncbi:hypothetical protein BJF79_32305 [Actinomadura sp. CNU-125]|uniref:class I SAM-dependent methyltransferase n=1 Tax=Actinomadura sp. CNU-125 TaxID=1904961 RepID=UPI00095FEBB4|nr:class I SAM-dependent methyltransferase [Actinomadura sp. CNU-125]OLT35443.1 hypothetical protein BJF79_32305 [Actinomadura sp. CNU-125]
MAAHYDSPVPRRLAGEIHFDARLSRAEVAMVVSAYRQVRGRDLPELVYLPCAGTLRHVPPLLARGVCRVVAVDLSAESLRAGLEHNVPDPARVEIYHGDVRDARAVLPSAGAPLVVMGGNSLGDITDPDGHLRFIAHLADALADDGVLVFDYVATGMCRPPGVPSPRSGPKPTAYPTQGIRSRCWTAAPAAPSRCPAPAWRCCTLPAKSWTPPPVNRARRRTTTPSWSCPNRNCNASSPPPGST